MKVYRTGAPADAEAQQAGSLEALLKVSLAARPSQNDDERGDGTTQAQWDDQHDVPASTNTPIDEGPSSGDWGDESHFNPPQSGRFVSGRASALNAHAGKDAASWGAARPPLRRRPAVTDVLHANAQSMARETPRLLTLPSSKSQVRPMLHWSRDEPDLSEDSPRDTIPTSAPPTERAG